MPQYKHYAQCDFKHINCLQQFKSIIASLKSVPDDSLILNNETFGEKCNCLPECFATVCMLRLSSCTLFTYFDKIFRNMI